MQESAARAPDGPAGASGRRIPPWLPAFLLAVAARLVGLGSRSLWVDEAFAAGLVGRSFGSVISMSMSGSPHPPLAFLFIKLSAALFGTSEAGLRALPLLFSALTVVPLHSLVSRWVGPRGAFWASIAWALAPFAVSLGQEAWLYAQLAFFTFLLVDLCDRAWRGSNRALVPAVLAAVAGIATNALFSVSVLMAWLLWFPAGGLRRPLRPALALAAVLAVSLPMTLTTAGQASLRMQRLAGAGFFQETPRRLAVGSAEVVSSLLTDGMAPPISRESLGRPANLAAVLGAAAFQAGALVILLSNRRLRPGFRAWALACAAAPFGVFLFEWPTARHLAILWVPLSLSLGAAASRWKAAGPVLAAIFAVLLVFYSGIGTYPYHRSDWRAAVRFVEDGLQDGDAVLVAAGQSGGLAYEYYSRNDAPFVSACAADPYSVQPVRGSVDVAGMLDSLLLEHPRVWMIGDFWGGMTARGIAGDRRVQIHRWVSPASEVVLVVRDGGRPSGTE